MQWLTLYKKELLGFWRNYQWIWVPIIFLILGMMEALSNYYMPEIIKMSGGLPEGSVFEFPVPTGQEVFIAGIHQFNTIGLLVLVLTNMGTIASERKSGVIELVLSKPVSLLNYLSSKYVAMLTFSIVSIFFGFLANFYYTNVLFHKIDIITASLSFLFYSVWFAFVLVIVLCLSTILTSGVAIGFGSIIASTIISVLSGIFSEKISWSPGLITTYLSDYLLTNSVPDPLPMTMIATILLIVLLIGMSLLLFFKKGFTVN